MIWGTSDEDGSLTTRRRRNDVIFTVTPVYGRQSLYCAGADDMRLKPFIHKEVMPRMQEHARASVWSESVSFRRLPFALLQADAAANYLYNDEANNDARMPTLAGTKDSVWAARLGKMLMPYYRDVVERESHTTDVSRWDVRACACCKNNSLKESDNVRQVSKSFLFELRHAFARRGYVFKSAPQQ